MGNVIVKLIDEILTVFKKNYNRPKLWIWMCIIIFCIVLLFPYIDSNFFYYSRMEKRIDILDKVMELDETKIYTNQAYSNEYQSILKEMEQQDKRSINSITNKVFNYMSVVGKEKGSIGWIKFFTGSIWFILITLAIPFMNTFKKRSDKIIVFILMTLITILVGWISSIIPIIIFPIINYIGVPALQIVILIAITIKNNKKLKST